MPKVIVLGGGVAGLSAAQELAERGYTVEVYERLPVFGGKARSIDIAGTAAPGKLPLPAEHGFRFFPGFYKHVTDTMSRIQVGGGRTVYDNLVKAPEVTVAQTTAAPWRFASNTPDPNDLEGWFRVFVSFYTRENIGLTRQDAVFFAKKLIRFLCSGDKRREGQYEKISWYDYIEAGSRSPQYAKIMGGGITLMLVAMRAQVASTRTVGTILTQLLIDIIDPNRESDRVLNAPTNEAWIDPWVTHLTNLGVSLIPNADVTAIQVDAQNKITGVDVSVAGVSQIVTGDHYVLALPVEIARSVLTPTQKNAAGISGIDALLVSWMNGVIFYLDRDIALSKGHSIYADSSWAITAIPQRQFWSVNLADYGQGNVQGVLSTVVSDWFSGGQYTTTKQAKDCTRAEVIAEVWEQMKRHHALAEPALRLDSVTPLHDFVDPAIQFTGGVNTNSEPLLINTVDSLKDRPDAMTTIDNLFLASDYVVTYTDLATMEGANEAARRAVNAILDKDASAQPRCALMPLVEPAIFKPFKQADDVVYGVIPGPPAPLPVQLETQLETIGQSILSEINSSSTPSGSTPWIVVALLAAAAVLAALFLL